MIENQNAYPMNLLVTLDRNYVPQLNVMLFSALQSDPAAFFDVYILHDEGLSASDLTATRALLGQRGGAASDPCGRKRADGRANVGPVSEGNLLPDICREISAAYAGPGTISRPGSRCTEKSAGVI